MKQYKAILFDFWNTLAQISDLDILTDEVKKTLGNDRYTQMMKHFVTWHITPFSQNIFMTHLTNDIALTKDEMPIVKQFTAVKKYEKFPETDETLHSLKNRGFKIILITNSPPNSKKALTDLELSDYFDKTVFSCDVGILKPDKQIFLHALKNFDIAPQDALMVGDSLEKDIMGAIDAGLDAILIDRTGSIDYAPKITHLNELLHRVKI